MSDIPRKRLGWPLAAWPPAWREGWRAARAQTGFLEEPAAASRWSARRAQQAEFDAGRFVAWLAARDPAALDTSLIESTTPAHLASFAQRERTRGLRWSTISTAAGNVIGVARAIGPEVEPQHLQRLWRILDHLNARAAREPKRPRAIARPEDLYDAGIVEMEDALDEQGAVRDPDAWQAGLMVALLAACPVRISNFAALELGKQLRDVEGEWHLHLDAAETKTRRSDAWPVPAGLKRYLVHFVDEVRPGMLCRAEPAADHARLWVGACGQPLENQGVRARIHDVTKRRLGQLINPHAFRHSAATAFVADHPEKPRDAAALLGHAGYKTTERHYVRSNRQMAILAAQEAVERFRRRAEKASASENSAPDDAPW
ncbi:MAG: site-specific integrase [Burkholderiales bacterium]|jgi:integrase|nr:site-specific integrase [Burkholderiales bacterium]